MLSISGCGATFYISGKYHDATGVSHDDKHHCSAAGLPLTYTSMSFGRNSEGTGFYWQIGAIIDYTIYLEPTAGPGVSIPYEMKRRPETVGHGRVLIGPFIAYAVTNMAKDKRVTMAGYTAGVRWIWVFM